jgi:predicted unusual protein kinase regulating ubiquinone biosynthesis (AarF/ABC1/UbiB family)
MSLLDCDPHPGNLLRTQDGRLCILDFGMVTRLDKDLQLTLIEHMAVRKKKSAKCDRWIALSLPFSRFPF